MRQLGAARPRAFHGRFPGPAGRASLAQQRATAATDRCTAARFSTQRRCGFARDSGRGRRSSSRRACGPSALPAQAVSRWTSDLHSRNCVDRGGSVRLRSMRVGGWRGGSGAITSEDDCACSRARVAFPENPAFRRMKPFCRHLRPGGAAWGSGGRRLRSGRPDFVSECPATAYVVGPFACPFRCCELRCKLRLKCVETGSST